MRLLFLIFAITLLVPTTTSRANGADPYLRATDLQNLPEPSIDTSLYPLNCSLHVEEWLPLSFSFAGQAASSASTVVAGKLLVFNIPSESHFLSRKDVVVDTFDPVTDTWRRSKSHQIPIKGDLLLVTSDGERYAYVAIGSHSPIHYFDRGHILTGVWRYDTATHEWTDLPQISRTVFLGGLTFSGKYLHFVGSSSVHDSKAAAECSHWRLDPSVTYPKWESAAPLSRCRENFHIVSLKGNVYVLGGTKSEGNQVRELDSMDHYELSSDSWTSLNVPLALSRDSSSVAVIYDTLAVISTRPENQFSHVIEFDTVADMWSTLVPLPRKLTQPVHFGLLSDSMWHGVKGDFIAVVSDINTIDPLAYMGRVTFPTECKLRAKKNVHPPKGVCEVLPHQP
jgi:N-acetylneuraminic acid mutarotase